MLTRYVWDYATNTCLAEVNEQGETTVEYTVNPQTGELISERRDGEDIYHRYDGDGNTRQTADSAGNVLGEATYTAFGEVVAESGDMQTTYRFRGQQGFSTDPVTRDVSRGNSSYSPSLGRMLTVHAAPMRRGISVNLAPAHAGRVNGRNGYVWATLQNRRPEFPPLRVRETSDSCTTCDRATIRWDFDPVIGFVVQLTCTTIFQEFCERDPCGKCRPVRRRSCRICFFELLKDQEQGHLGYFNDEWKISAPDKDLLGCGVRGTTFVTATVRNFVSEDLFDEAWERENDTIDCGGFWDIKVGPHFVPAEVPPWWNDLIGEVSSFALFKYDCCEAPSRSGLIYGALPNPALPSAGADVSLPPQLPTLGGCMSATGARP